MIQIASWFLGATLVLSALAVILVRKPVHASLSFLVTLMSLAGFYLLLSAEFIAAMQVLIYAGAILVIFMFVIILFQDAHQQIDRYEANTSWPLVSSVAVGIAALFFFLATRLPGLLPERQALPENFGLVSSLGKTLYLDYFFPFEVIVLLFLIALIGSLYIARRGG